MIINKYDFAIFDVDGTLLDTTEGVLSSVQYTIEKYGLKQIDNETLLRFIGPPIQDSFKEVYDIEDEKLQELATIFRNRYKDVDLLKAKPYPQIFELFDLLVSKGVKIAVATYKRQDYAERILRHFGFDKYTNIIHGADHENRLKKVDIIRNCLDDFSVKDFKRVVMIGDSLHDAIGAEKIGTEFIGVTYGFDFKTKEDVEKHPHIGYANSPLEIAKFF